MNSSGHSKPTWAHSIFACAFASGFFALAFRLVLCTLLVSVSTVFLLCGLLGSTFCYLAAVRRGGSRCNRFVLFGFRFRGDILAKTARYDVRSTFIVKGYNLTHTVDVGEVVNVTKLAKHFYLFHSEWSF